MIHFRLKNCSILHKYLKLIFQKNNTLNVSEIEDVVSEKEKLFVDLRAVQYKCCRSGFHTLQGCEVDPEIIF